MHKFPRGKGSRSSTLYQLRTDNRFLVAGVRDPILRAHWRSGSLLRPSLLHFGGVDLETGSRLVGTQPCGSLFAGEAGRGEEKGRHVMRVGVELAEESPRALKYCIVLFLINGFESKTARSQSKTSQSASLLPLVGSSDAKMTARAISPSCACVIGARPFWVSTSGGFKRPRTPRADLHLSVGG
jgi:hypothetical protein